MKLLMYAHLQEPGVVRSTGAVQGEQAAAAAASLQAWAWAQRPARELHAPDGMLAFYQKK